MTSWQASSALELDVCYDGCMETCEICNKPLASSEDVYHDSCLDRYAGLSTIVQKWAKQEKRRIPRG